MLHRRNKGGAMTGKDIIMELQGTMTNSEFAKVLNISRVHLWRIKNDKCKIGVSVMQSIKKEYPTESIDLFFTECVAQNTQHKLKEKKDE